MHPIFEKPGILVAILFIGLYGATAQESERSNLHLYRQGRQIFLSQCVPCHGKTGRGDGPWAAGMLPAPRNLRFGIFKYRTTPMGFMPTDDDLRRTISGGISGTGMPTFKGHLRDSEIDALIVYVKSMSRRWRDPELVTEAYALPETPAWFDNSAERARRVEQGNELFQATCTACHGPSGRGDGEGAKGLLDAWGNPAVPANLAVPHLRSGDSPKDPFRTIAMGLDGTPMIGFRGALTDEQIWSLVAFVQSLPMDAPAK